MKPNNKKNISRFYSLIAIAFADGVIHENERTFLYLKGKDYNLSTEEIDLAIEHAGDLKFEIPEGEEERETFLTEIVYMAMIDGDVHPTERQFCMKVAEKLDFSDEDLEVVITLAKNLWRKEGIAIP